MSAFVKKTCVAGILGLSLLLATTPSARAETSAPVPAIVHHLTTLYGAARPPATSLPGQQSDPLGHLLGLQKRHWAQAWVTSTFYDWRTVSKYRRAAGLHLGYDIALPYGTPVSAAWPGVVTAVIPWTSSEYGVTVTSHDGTEVTYGHITPSVHIGSKIATGQIVGNIASDHVDVKMRGATGQYIPFGEDSTESVPSTVAVSRNSLLTTWLVAKSSALQAEEDLFLAENAQTKWELERRSTERRIEVLESTLERLTEAKSQGLVSLRRLEEIKSESAQAHRRLKDLQRREKSTPAQLRENHKVSQAHLQAVASWAKREGLGWSDVEALISQAVSASKPLQKKVERERADAQGPGQSLEQLRQAKAKGAERLARLEELYKSGGLSRQEIESQRLKQQLLSEELDLRTRRKYR